MHTVKVNHTSDFFPGVGKVLPVCPRLIPTPLVASRKSLLTVGVGEESAGAPSPSAGLGAQVAHL